jgi:hypothetical protein
VQQIGKRMLDICAKEGLSMNQATMDALVQVGGGVRGGGLVVAAAMVAPGCDGSGQLHALTWCISCMDSTLMRRLVRQTC